MAARKSTGGKKASGAKKKPAAQPAAPKAAAKKATRKKAPAAAPAKRKAAPRAKKPAPEATAPAEKRLVEEVAAAAPDEPVAARDDAAAPAKGAEAAEGAEGAGTVQEVAAPPRRARRVPPMPPRRADGTITVALSPDADDAFMFYALAAGKVDTQDRRYELVREEIQVLNERAREGVHDVTAISFGAFPHLEDRYLLLTCGASFGDGRGPVLVAKTPIRTNEVNGLTVAVPGLLTTAALALRLWLPHANLNLVEVPFDDVVDAVRSGRTRAGVLIHERQLTWREDNLVRIVDFAQWWGEKTEGLPLPLGANAIRRDIPEEERTEIALDIKRSIAYGLGHREEALDHAMHYAKGIDKKLVDEYVGMYVNELALDYAERGRQAVRHFFEEAKRFRLVPPDLEPDFA